MTFRRLLQKIFLVTESKEMNLLVYYRYLSLGIISFFYMIGELNHSYQKKLFIIICISISAYILNYLYIKNAEEKQKIKLLIFIETIGNCFILIPSGGISSPYIWYMLNTIILSALKLNKKNCFLNISTYLVILFMITLFSNKINMVEALYNANSQTNLNLVMSFALVIGAVLYLSTLIKDLEKKNKSIIEKNTRFEKVNERLIVTQEQNRIANEIHDSVLQRLFSMSFSIYAIIKKLDKSSNQQVRDELNIVRNAIDNSMKELRSTIYGLSSQKNGHNIFNENIMEYIAEIKGLTNTDIKYDLMGSIDVLSVSYKKALYRIICEGISNAIRHGKSLKVQVELKVQKNTIDLEIDDDGIGFEQNKIKKDTQTGLGLNNIRDLTYSLNGEIYITSKVGKGTTIKVTIPRDVPVLIKEEAV